MGEEGGEEGEGERGVGANLHWGAVLIPKSFMGALSLRFSCPSIIEIWRWEKESAGLSWSCIC